ncbi:MAG TPA: hypothetical protein VN442_16745 [Bryobacteraceae bacterium]|nr:hypothetical protein [Bryobacteraceae bacterium]
MSFLRLVPLAAGWLFTVAACAATFGTVVPIGGHASDLALDEARGVVYVANFTANKIDIISIRDNSIRTSINVAPQPGGLALSPDGQYLVVAHFGAWAAPGTSRNSLTVVNLNDNTRQTFAMSFTPLGVAFGADGLAMVVTSSELLLFDPVSGAVQPISTIAELAARALPAKIGQMPPNIIAASVAASADGMVLYGLADLAEEGVIRYRYDVQQRTVSGFAFIASPTVGPRVISPSRDGSFYFAGWGLFDANSNLISQFKNVTGAFETGSHAIDMDGGVIYAQLPEPARNEDETVPPVLMVLDSASLAVRERISLQENLAGRAVLNAARDVMYSVSDSGIMVLPVGSLSRYHRVQAQQEDLVFRGNFCDRRVITQDIVITDPGGGQTDFTLRASAQGVTVTPSSGVTPAVVQVRIDPNAFTTKNGTVTVELQILSASAVNLPLPVRLLINNRNPDQRGTFVNVPGKLVDILADPVRDRFYVLRQDLNQVLVFDGANQTQIGAMKTYNTPTQMTITVDRRYLLVGHDDSQFAAVYDLDTLEQKSPIIFPFGHYPRSIAASGKAILGLSRLADGTGTIDSVDAGSRRAVNMPSLGVYENKVHVSTVLTAAPNGASILAASADGNVMLYSANADTFTISRKDFTKLSGAYAASSFDQYVVNNVLLNASLVPVTRMETGTGLSSGFTFMDDTGFRLTTPGDTAPGVIQRVNPYSGQGSRPTRMAEAPTMPVTEAAAQASSGTGTFTRTVAALYNRTALVAITQSGITVVPWNYDATTAPPRIDTLVNAADMTLPVAPGGLITVFGSDFSPVNVATRELPLPTALGESCLTVNGVALPMLFVSPTQINAQLPFNMGGNTVLVLRTPGGVSNNFNFTVLPTAPSVFRSGAAGPVTDIPTVYRASNGQLVTGSNPIHMGDTIIIWATGLGVTDPAADAGQPAPSNPLSRAIIEPTLTLGGVPLPVLYAGLAPGQVGVYQINATVPIRVPEGLDVPLSIVQGGSSTTLPVRVVK